jgi:hypothetical protein
MQAKGMGKPLLAVGSWLLAKHKSANDHCDWTPLILRPLWVFLCVLWLFMEIKIHHRGHGGSQGYPARTACVVKIVFTDCTGLRSNRERTTSPSICNSFKTSACDGFPDG